jgi:hypothetical protein
VASRQRTLRRQWPRDPSAAISATPRLTLLDDAERALAVERLAAIPAATDGQDAPVSSPDTHEDGTTETTAA